MAPPSYHGRTHVPGGSDPIPGLFVDPGGADLEGVILSGSPNGFWKLNETSGTTAADSSGNGRNLIVGSDSAPTWAQAAGPPGDVTAGFGTAGQRLHYSSFPAPAGDFTIVGWGYYTDTHPANSYAFAGQGGTLGGSGQDGWWFGVAGGLQLDPKHLIAEIGAGSGVPDRMVSNSALTESTWYQVALVKAGSTFTLYVDGLAQTDTSTHAITYASGDFMVGQLNSTSLRLDGRMSWWAYYSSALTSSDLLGFIAAASAPFTAAGLVWTSDGDGGATWELGTVEVDY